MMKVSTIERILDPRGRTYRAPIPITPALALDLNLLQEIVGRVEGTYS